MDKLRKTKAIMNIEQQMAGLKPQDMRYKVLEAARNFKSSWLQLGRYLYTVYNDKLYREWGFMAFEAYCHKELGIRSQTAVKLLKSYYFIEKDEPDLLTRIPNYESANILRLARNNPNIDEQGYEGLKKEVIEKQRDFTDVGKQFRSMIMRARQENDPEEAHRKAFQRKIRNVISSLKVIKSESEIRNILPDKLFRLIDELISALEMKLEEV